MYVCVFVCMNHVCTFVCVCVCVCVCVVRNGINCLMFLAMMWICPLYDKIENSFKHSISRGGWGSLILYVEEESYRVDFCKIVCRHQQFLLDPNYKDFDQLTVEIV